jgi:hypothetical protein
MDNGHPNVPTEPTYVENNSTERNMQPTARSLLEIDSRFAKKEKMLNERTTDPQSQTAQCHA